MFKTIFIKVVALFLDVGEGTLDSRLSSVLFSGGM